MAEIIKFDAGDPVQSRTQIVKIKRILNLGGLIAFPTDTFYGLGANPFHSRAVARIYKVKEREEDKPLLVLISSLHQVERLALEISPAAEAIIKELWPGPVTLLFTSRPHLSAQLTANTGKIGIRLPGNAFTQNLLAEIGYPITATSANISGTENAATAEEVETALGSRIDVIIDGGPAPGGKESTVLDVTLSPPLIVREGAVPKEKIEAVIEMPCISVP